MEYDHKKASGEKILIVDDVELNRLILEEIIKNMDKIKDKIILDTRNICTNDNVYKL